MNEIDYSPFKDPENYPLPISESIQQLIVALRRQILLQFVEDLVVALEAENYSPYELVECLAHFTHKRGWSEVTKDLDLASEKLLEIHNRSRSKGGMGEAPASPSEE